METEKWRPVVGYEGYYEVSSQGRVKSLPRQIQRSNGRVQTFKERILRPGINKWGYLFVILSNTDELKNHRMHRLVGEAFIDVPCAMDINTLHINHIDGNKKNNHVYNLEWATPLENNVHAYDAGLKQSTTKVTDEQIITVMNLRCDGKTYEEIAQEIGIKECTVGDIITGRRFNRKLKKLGLKTTDWGKKRQLIKIDG